MSSSRLTRLRNKAGGLNQQPPLNQKQHPQQTQQQNTAPVQQGPVNPMKILTWHETRLKDLKERMDYIEAGLSSLANSEAPPRQSGGDAEQLLAINDVLDRLGKLTTRVENVEVLSKNLKDDYLTFKNGNNDNRVELIINNRVDKIKNAETVAQETTNEIKEMRDTLAKLDIEPTQKEVKSITLDLTPKIADEDADIVGFSEDAKDLIGSAI
jgi:hypothetical protein